jgi:aminoglycoside phosphotransferase (APT) family kinase protein
MAERMGEQETGVTTRSCTLGVLIRGYHDAAATMLWTGREWCFEAREPVETICHNELKMSNTVRSGVPVALIDWDTAAPGPRAWDLGFAAWFWVRFWRDEKCRAAGLPTGIAEKARWFRKLFRRSRVTTRTVHRAVASQAGLQGPVPREWARGPRAC